MHPDEQAIRDVIKRWIQASMAGDTEQVLALMSDDIVFLTPGRPPFGKDAFATASRASAGKVRVDGKSTVEEVQLASDTAHVRTKLRVSMTPTAGGETKHLSGYTLSVFRKENDRWLLARDANVLTPEKRGVNAVVPVFHVVSVKKSIAWYADILGFSANPFGPSDEPVFAILQRDGQELMLQNSCAMLPQRSGDDWDAYIRVADVEAMRESVRAKVPGVEGIELREYGCREFTVTDPDGHVLVIGQCD
jgi:uncharacterized protein (TIGR02246 family)